MKLNSSSFYKALSNPFNFKIFLVSNLPAALYSGVKLLHATEEECVVTVPYKWFTRNPFRSTYFACLSMAAEMSTGILALANIYQRTPKVSMLVVAIEGKFYKKAIGKTKFVCKDGQSIMQSIQLAIDSGA